MKLTGCILITVVSLAIFTEARGAEGNFLRIDASSEEMLKNSIEMVKQSLPVSQQKKFEEAYGIILIDAFQGFEEGGEEGKEAIWETFHQAFNGKTGLEIIEEATAIVQSLKQKQHEKEIKKTTYDFPKHIFDEKLFDPNRSSYSCTGILYSSIQPADPFGSDADKFKITEESFLKNKEEILSLEKLREFRVEATSNKGTDKVAIEIKGKTMNLITVAAVNVGISTPAEFKVMTNDENILYATLNSYESLAYGFSANTFLLNKRSGLAIWTKSREKNVLANDKAIPESSSNFLRCL